MEKFENFSVLKTVPLFKGIREDELESALKCLSPQKKVYSKGELILRAGDPVTSVGIVISGRIQVIKEDYSGSRNILAEATAGSIFAEAFSCAKIEKLPVTVLSVTGSEILFFDYQRIISRCGASCVYHFKMIENMLEILAKNNLLLNQKIEHSSKRTTRDKLLSYLSEQAQLQGSSSFAIPFNRQELADYLCVERSAMSNELCKLRDEGYLRFEKNEFILHPERND